MNIYWSDVLTASTGQRAKPEVFQGLSPHTFPATCTHTHKQAPTVTKASGSHWRILSAKKTNKQTGRAAAEMQRSAQKA